MPLKLKNTKITPTDSGLLVEMTWADANRPENVVEFVQVCLRAKEAQENWHLPAIQRVALLQLQTLVNDEILDAQSKLDRSRA